MNTLLSHWRQAALLTSPVMLGYVPLGLAFGIVSVQMGYPWWAAPLMSVAIYSGASQFLLLTLLAANASLADIAIASFLLGSRHLFYGLSLLERFAGAGARKPYLIYALTDETYSLLASRPEASTPAMAFRISLLDQLWWLTGALAGALIGRSLPFDSTGMDFALTALFIVLLIDMLSAGRQTRPVVIGLICAAIALLWLPPEHLLLAAIGGACLVLLLDYARLRRHTDHAGPAP